MTGTGAGSGYSPLAPGTAGSLLALVVYFLFPLEPLYWVLIAIIVMLIGIPVSSHIEKDRGEDAGLIVIDEIAGQWITLLFLPRTGIILLLGFILFRVFDIWKPFPIDRSQRLKGGLGVMADDVLAGVLANIILHVIVWTGILI